MNSSFEFYKFWEELGFTSYGTTEDIFINDLKKIARYFKKQKSGNLYTAGYISYNYEDIIAITGHAMYAWTIISMFAKADFIDWGTSIRFGSTTTKGSRFLYYIDKYPTEVLEVATDGEQDVKQIYEFYKEHGTTEGYEPYLYR